MISLIEEACTAGARLAKACKIVALSPRTVQRWQRPDDVPSDGRKAAAVDRVPANKLSEAERSDLLTTVNQAEYAHLPPSQIVPKLADDGRYLASESTIYRILHEEKQLAHRGRAKGATKKRPEAFIATAPKQIWSWDITYISCGHLEADPGLFFKPVELHLQPSDLRIKPFLAGGWWSMRKNLPITPRKPFARPICEKGSPVNR